MAARLTLSLILTTRNLLSTNGFEKPPSKFGFCDGARGTKKGFWPIRVKDLPGFYPHTPTAASSFGGES